MHANPIKSIWIVIIITVTILSVASPHIAAASMDSAVDNCDSGPYHEKSFVPMFCLTGDCLLDNCCLSNAADNIILPPGRFFPINNVYIAVSNTGASTVTPHNSQRPLQRYPTQELSTYLCTEYHCRNCLDSEEPHNI